MRNRTTFWLILYTLFALASSSSSLDLSLAPNLNYADSSLYSTPEMAISEFTEQPHTSPDISVLRLLDITVTVWSSPGVTGNTVIFAELYSPFETDITNTGTVLLEEENTDLLSPKVAALDSGSILVLWVKQYPDFTSAVFMKIFSQSLSEITSEVRVSSEETLINVEPAAIGLKYGYAAVAWVCQDCENTTDYLYVKILDELGTEWLGETLVTSIVLFETIKGVSIARMHHGGFLVT